MVKSWKKSLAAAVFLAVMSLQQTAGAEGFGINEWSAEGVAMGGARMFAEEDPANLAYNPAAITKVHGEAWKTGVVYISPHGKYKAYDAAGNLTETGKNRVSPGLVPHLYYVRQIDEKQWFGIGSFVRFGMISEFESASAVATNAYYSKLNGMSVVPTYAWKPDKKVSAAVGLEINYAELTLRKKKNIGYLIDTKTTGDSVALGWNTAVSYAFDDKNEFGLVYRSKIRHSMNAKFTASYSALNSDAYGKVTMPDSFALGYNHKFDDKTRIELNGTYTRWSTFNQLNISFENPYVPDSNDTKDWANGWRYALGVEHKLSDKYTVMAGFAFDESVIPEEHADFMIPTGSRRTYSLGVQYHDSKQTLALTLGHLDIGGKKVHAKDGDSFGYADTYDNNAKVVAISYAKSF